MPLVESAPAASLATSGIPSTVVMQQQGSVRFEATALAPAMKKKNKDHNNILSVGDGRVCIHDDKADTLVETDSDDEHSKQDTLDSTHSSDASSDEEAEPAATQLEHSTKTAPAAVAQDSNDDTVQPLMKQPIKCDASTAVTLDMSQSSASTFASHSAVPQPLQPRELPRRRSMLKPESVVTMEDLSISPRKKVWMTLPPPDMNKILQRSVTVDTAATSEPLSTTSAGAARKGVRFADVNIREYDMTLGDNPSVSIGPPISLDWTYEEQAALDLEDYEAQRGPRRMLRQMMMNYYQRRNLLLHTYGHSEMELKKAEKQVNKIRSQRGTTRYFLQFSKVMDAVESTGRKTKRLVKGGKKKNK